MEGVIVVVIALLAATGFGLWRTWADGRLRGHRSPDEVRMTADELGHQLGSAATFVQFSTAFCQPCRANRQVLGHLAGSTDGVVHVDIDAESHLELVRRLGVTRTPTTFVLDSAGIIRHRVTGPLRLGDAKGAVAAVANP